MTPVVALMERPAGKDGDTEYETTVPPFVVGETAVIAVPLVKVNEFGL